jgi:hypothetical protein
MRDVRAGTMHVVADDGDAARAERASYEQRDWRCRDCGCLYGNASSCRGAPAIGQANSFRAWSLVRGAIIRALIETGCPSRGSARRSGPYLPEHARNLNEWR